MEEIFLDNASTPVPGWPKLCIVGLWDGTNIFFFGVSGKSESSIVLIRDERERAQWVSEVLQYTDYIKIELILLYSAYPLRYRIRRSQSEKEY